MFRVDVSNKKLLPMRDTNLSGLGLKERYDLQEWIEGRPEILGEELLIIAKELILSSGRRLDLLAVDHEANLVVIELKRDESGDEVAMQAIKYASYVSNFSEDDIYETFATTLKSDNGVARSRIEGFVDSIESLNQSQRIILVAREFHPEVASAVLWLRDYEIDIKCVRLRTYLDDAGELYITPDTIIPLPEAKDYIERKEVRQRAVRQSSAVPASSLQKGAFELPELEERLRMTLSLPSPRTPRLVAFIELLLSQNRVFKREEVLTALFAAGIGRDIGQTGRYMSGLSQQLTEPGNSHLRQVIAFTSDGNVGDQKDNFAIADTYRPLLQGLVTEWHEQHPSSKSDGTL